MANSYKKHASWHEGKSSLSEYEKITHWYFQTDMCKHGDTHCWIVMTASASQYSTPLLKGRQWLSHLQIDIDSHDLVQQMIPNPSWNWEPLSSWWVSIHHFQMQAELMVLTKRESCICIRPPSLGDQQNVFHDLKRSKSWIRNIRMLVLMQKGGAVIV